ncbi:MAG TPA: MgtC/SapB family protein [Pseudomonas sp.]|nr:MgtC/SapB family protein [Pseudomonas sp.]
MTPDLTTWLDLASALAIGLLIGAERGWSARDTQDTLLSAGIRTYGLVGLLGGLASLLAGHFGALAWLALLLALGVLITAAYLVGQRYESDPGVTSEIALLLTFLLGSLALAHSRLLAAGCAVVVALLLSLKEPMHAALKRLSASELSGALKLLFISLVLLPALPDQGYGPWQVFNPYATWWMVVLIAGLGFAAYVAMRLVGTRHGLLLTALLGGLVSSTAMTLTLSRMHEQRELHAPLAAGLLATSALMFPRVLLEVAAINPPLLGELLWPLGAAALLYAGGALYWWWRAAAAEHSIHAEPPLKNPFELGPALRFAALLAAILLLVEAGRRELGDVGVYLVSLLSGLTDVDAITLSLSRSALGELDPQVAVRGIALAVTSNSLIKAVLIAMIGGPRLALMAVPPMAAGLGLGLLLVLF